MKKFLFTCLASSFLIAQDGCSIFKKGNTSSAEQKTAVGKHEVQTRRKYNITKTLSFVESVHEGKKVLIRREGDMLKECPPFCIQPMKIDNVVTVGELETLEFIEKLKEKKLRLLLDVRENDLYQQATIPGAINLPLSMLDQESSYYEKVLKLLGAKKLDGEWHFKEVHTLLIFGEGFMNSDASEMIRRLLSLNYPQEKILYYRGGLESWKESGLTTY
jgi:rhodanese-related sulfurtransferase